MILIFTCLHFPGPSAAPPAVVVSMDNPGSMIRDPNVPSLPKISYGPPNIGSKMPNQGAPNVPSDKNPENNKPIVNTDFGGDSNLPVVNKIDVNVGIPVVSDQPPKNQASSNIDSNVPLDMNGQNLHADKSSDDKNAEELSDDSDEPDTPNISSSLPTLLNQMKNLDPADRLKLENVQSLLIPFQNVVRKPGPRFLRPNSVPHSAFARPQHHHQSRPRTKVDWVPAGNRKVAVDKAPVRVVVDLQNRFKKSGPHQSI